MKLEDAPELNRDLKSPIQEMDLEDHLTRLTLLPGSNPGTCYASAAHSDQQQELTNVQVPESGHAGPGLSGCNPTNT